MQINLRKIPTDFFWRSIALKIEHVVCDFAGTWHLGISVCAQTFTFCELLFGSRIGGAMMENGPWGPWFLLQTGQTSICCSSLVTHGHTDGV